MLNADIVAFVSDDHAPYTNGDTLRCRLEIIRYLKPDVLFLGGDHVDFYQISKFSADPERVGQLQDDLDYAHDLLRRYRKAAGDGCKLYYLQGNHEERMQSYIWRRAEAFASLRSMRVPKQLGLDDFGIEWVEGGWIDYKGFIFKHGNTVRSKSGYSASGEMDRFWMSGMSGHTHRLGHISKTVYKQTYDWIEAGCGCDLLEYIKGGPGDWRQGMGYAYYLREKKLWIPHSVAITNGVAEVEGKLF